MVWVTVLIIVPFSTVDEAIELANDTKHSLTAGLWTRSLEYARTVGPRIHSGYVHSFPASPFSPPCPCSLCPCFPSALALPLPALSLSLYFLSLLIPTFPESEAILTPFIIPRYVNINGPTIHSELKRGLEGLGGSSGYGSFAVEEFLARRMMVWHPEGRREYAMFGDDE